MFIRTKVTHKGQRSSEVSFVQSMFLYLFHLLCILDDFEALLVMSNRNRIYTNAINSRTINTLVSNTGGPSNIISMDINTEEEVIYYGDSSTNRIWKTDINGTNTTTVWVVPFKILTPSVEYFVRVYCVSRKSRPQKLPTNKMLHNKAL